jgi:arylsulfatase A-like enzyme
LADSTIRGAQTFDVHHRKALELILSPDARSAFDLRREPDRVRDRYGRFEMGQVLLLARRLVEAGVRFVTANAVSHPPNTKLSAYQIWDTHFDHFRLYDSHLMPELDQALSALLADLADRGLLDETLVLVMGEFGRTPRIDNVAGGGRDHWPRAYSVLLAGGGVRGGTVFGRTDAVAGSVTDFPVRPDDLAATIFEALGIPADAMLPDLRQRPHRITEGRPIRALFG